MLEIMPRKLTKEEFVKRANVIHKDKYDYSSVVYINSNTNVNIICKIHGIYLQTPHAHLNGQGCPKCGIIKNALSRKGSSVDSLKKVLFNECYNDLDDSVKGIANKAYYYWRNMLVRCYSEKYKKEKPSYRSCCVCDEWKRLSNFKKWFDKNYVKGYQLDKDILVKGNKIYSPQTCCFVPPAINNLLLNRSRSRGTNPIGVKTRGNKYYAEISIKGEIKYLGIFETKDEAFKAYKQAKEEYIKEVAQKYYDKREINKRVYDALMKYEVEITD